MTTKLTDFDSTIENAFVESVEYDGEVTAFRASVADGVMTICDLQFEVELDDFDDLYEFWNTMDPDEMDEFAIRKIMQDVIQSQATDDVEMIAYYSRVRLFTYLTKMTKSKLSTSRLLVRQLLRKSLQIHTTYRIT